MKKGVFYETPCKEIMMTFYVVWREWPKNNLSN